MSVQEVKLARFATYLYSFNTSYVSVQVVETVYLGKRAKFQYILCVGSSVRQNVLFLKSIVFQYILCVGSSWLLGWL